MFENTANGPPHAAEGVFGEKERNKARARSRRMQEKTAVKSLIPMFLKQTEYRFSNHQGDYKGLLSWECEL